MSLILSVIAIFISGIVIGMNLNQNINNRYDR
jgi:hypothetical protein